MDLDPARGTKRRHAEWKAKHVDRGDGYCIACRRWAPCIFAQAAGAKEKPRPAEAPRYGAPKWLSAVPKEET